MFTVITVTPLLVISLRCYHGSEGIAIPSVVEVGEGKMCAYETMRPCEFKENAGNRSNYRAASYVPLYAKQCFNRHSRAICYCQSDLCNGNFKLILERWENTTHANKTEYECVREYIRKKKDLYYPPPTVAMTTKQGAATTKTAKTTQTTVKTASTVPLTTQKTTANQLTKNPLPLQTTTTTPKARPEATTRPVKTGPTSAKRISSKSKGMPIEP
ncbi:hypothetical protein Aduo_017111 [Ancylostoma duodenale]